MFHVDLGRATPGICCCVYIYVYICVYIYIYILAECMNCITTMKKIAFLK